MLQALASIAFVAILGSALLAGSLANANVAAHQLETRGIRSGLERGTNDAVAFARRRHGLAGHVGRGRNGTALRVGRFAVHRVARSLLSHRGG